MILSQNTQKNVWLKCAGVS